MILISGFAAATGKKLFLGMQGANPCCQPCRTAHRGSLLGVVKSAAQGPRLTTALAPRKQTHRQGYTRGKNTLWWSCSLYLFWCTPKHAPSTVCRIITIVLLRRVSDIEIKASCGQHCGGWWNLLPMGSHASAEHHPNTTTKHHHCNTTTSLSQPVHLSTDTLCFVLQHQHCTSTALSRNWRLTQLWTWELSPSAAPAGALGAKGGHQHERVAEREAMGFCTTRGRVAQVI